MYLLGLLIKGIGSELFIPLVFYTLDYLSNTLGLTNVPFRDLLKMLGWAGKEGRKFEKKSSAPSAMHPKTSRI